MSKREAVFAVLALLGAVGTWTFNLQAAAAPGGLSAVGFVRAAFATPVSSSLSVDLIVTAAAFFCWAVPEARRLRMRLWPAYIVLTFVIALAFACPLFLWQRERKLRMDAA